MLFPFSPQWVFSVPSVRRGLPDRFVISFPDRVPPEFSKFVLKSYFIDVERVYVCPVWRRFREGVAVRVIVRDRALAKAIKAAAPKGGGGSLHPALGMLRSHYEDKYLS